MTRDIRSLAPSNASGDLAPLFANDTYTRLANSELATVDAAEAAAAAKLAVDDNYRGVVSMFGSACASLRAIAAKFPELGKFVDEAIKQVQLAMSSCVGNPVLEAPKPIAPNASSAPFFPAPAAKPVTAAENDDNLRKIRESAARARSAR